MLDCKLIPVTQDNLDVASKLTAEFGFPRSVNWIRRALFNPHVASCDSSARRGYMLKSQDDGYVGIVCYSPMKLYLKDRPLIGYSGLLLGVRKKYGEWLIDLFKVVQDDEKGHLAFGNTSCSAHATRICRLARGDKLGPEECGYWRVSFLGPASYILGVLRKCLRGRLLGVCWTLLFPLRALQACWHGIKVHGSSLSMRVEREIPKNDLSFFWNRYLQKNTGLVASREPEILMHLFADSLAAQRLVLITARDTRGIAGYVLLRKYFPFDDPCIIKYKIIDAIAVGNDVGCLKALLRYVKYYAAGHSGERVEYIGGNPDLASWIDLELPRKKSFGFNTTTYYYSGTDTELIEAVESRAGWFFGPYDGERCLGHLGAVDL